MTATQYIRTFLCFLAVSGGFVGNSFAKSTDVKFPVLQINSRSFTNVTITTVEREFICLIHARGMESIRVDELPADLRQQLGCDSIPKPVKVEAPLRVSDETADAGDVAPRSFLAQLERYWFKIFSGGVPTRAARMSFIATLLFLCFVAHVVRSICARVICEKTGVNSGFGIWFPNWQWFYFFPAAGMSRFWALLRILFFALYNSVDYHSRREFAIPLLALYVLLVIVEIVWCIKIANARDKNAFCTLIILFPVVEVIGWLYLAVDKSEKVEKAPKLRREILTLDTA